MNRVYSFFLLFIILGILSLFINGQLYNNEIEFNKKTTVCKFIYCKTYPKTTNSFFEYIINNKSYKNSYGNCPEKYDQKINKFFILHYSSKDPKKIIVDFTIQIIDSVEIFKAGFSKKDFN